jgi:hypothetical protein
VPNLNIIDPAAVNGLPVAGNFDGVASNGDEVAIFDGKVWHFDTDHDFLVGDAGGSFKLATSMRGYPVVGDFNGDGLDDLGTWADDRFQIDLAAGPGPLTWDGVADHTFHFGFIGVRERPVAADMNADGFDDLGLWVPDREGQIPNRGEWYFLVSSDAPVTDRITFNATLGRHVIDFKPAPFGEDMFFSFGDQFALPVVGNFDPPVVKPVPILFVNQNIKNKFDVNDDSKVDTQDLLAIARQLFIKGSYAIDADQVSAPYYDVYGDNIFNPRDAAMLLAHLARSSGAAEGESQKTDAYYFDLGRKEKERMSVYEEMLLQALEED